MKWIPRNYQKNAARFLLQNPAAALFLDPGLGKTSAMLAALDVFFRKGIADSALIVAPLRVMQTVWPAEVEKWDQFSYMTTITLHGREKENGLEYAAELYLINPEGIVWLESQPRELLPDVLVLDESTRFKNWTAKRTRALRRMAPHFTRRYCLTGTPMPNSYLDLFPQVYLMDLGEALGRYITRYRSEFFYDAGHGFSDWKILPGAAEQIEKRIAHLALRMRAEDYLELPKLIETTIHIELPKMARLIYADLEDKFFAHLEKQKRVTAVTAGALSIKLRQVAAGAVYPDHRLGKEWETIHDAKLDALESLIEELSGAPMLVAYEFQHDLYRLRKRFGDVPTLTGVSANQARSTIDFWNAGELPMLAIHPASAGHGVNLQEGGHHLCFFGLGWNAEDHAQMIRRIYRQGQEQPVHVYRLIAKGTIEEAVVAAVAKKERRQTKMLDAIEAYRRRKR